MEEEAKKQIEDLVKRIDEIESSLNAAKRILNRLNDDYLKVDYTQIEGIVGKYDGIYMQGEDGKKYDVSQNYAAKSKLVFGDVLKLIEEDGKKLYKQIERVKRERVEGILTKKEGEWYILTDRGSYRISDAAAEFQKAEINSQASAFLPADNLNAPFATLDNVEGASVIKGKNPVDNRVVAEKNEANLKDIHDNQINLKKVPDKKVQAEPKASVKPTEKPAPKPSAKPTSRPASKPAPRPTSAPRPAAKPVPAPRPAPKPAAEEPEAEIKSIDKDDLV